MYTALIVIMLGVALYNYTVFNFLSLCVLILVISRKVIIEEALLCERFPEYQHYQRHTARFMPFLL